MRTLALTMLTTVAILCVGCFPPRSLKERAPILPAWTTSLGDRRIEDVIYTGDRLLVRVGYNRLVSLDAVSGRSFWDRTIPVVSRFRQGGKLHDAYFTEEVLATNGHVYFLGPDECVHILDDRIGTELGHSGPVFSLLGATESAVYVLDSAQHLTELTASGRVHRQTMVEGHEATRLKISGDQLILECPSCSPPLQVLDRNAQPLWNSVLPEAVSSTVGSDQLYFTTGKEKRDIVALDRSTGQELWRFTIAVRSMASGAPPLLLVDQQLTDSPLYVVISDVGSQELCLLILDRRSGQQRSKLRLPWDTSAFDGGARIAHRILYMTQTKLHGFLESFDSGTRDSRLHAVDIGTGKELWCSAWRFEVLDTPVVSHDLIYVSTWGQYKNPSSVQAFPMK